MYFGHEIDVKCFKLFCFFCSYRVFFWKLFEILTLLSSVYGLDFQLQKNMDPGFSLFNPGESIRVNSDDHGKEEYEDDLEERKRKEKELQEELLDNRFDDLIDDDDSSTVASEDGGPIPYKNTKVHQWPNGKENETSTPKNQALPHWTMNYTPINGINKTNRMRLPRSKENGLEHVSEENPNTSFNDELDNMQSRVPNGITTLNQNGQDHEEGGFLHQEYAHNLVTLKENMLKQQEEQSREIRVLKHQLIMAKGEKDNLIFSLQQARQLLVDKEQQVSEFQKDVQQLESELDKERKTNEELANQVKISQSSIDDLKNQISELTQYENLMHLRTKNDNTLKMTENRHKQETTSLQIELREKDSLIKRLKAQVEELEKYQEHTLPDKLRGISQLTRTLESVENHCRKLLSTEALKDAEYLTAEQNQQESKDIEHRQQINLLMNAINELGRKLQDNSGNVPLEVYTKTIEKLEREKIELQNKYEILSQEISRLESDKKQLTENNARLNATMETMIKKHDLDIKSAIDKYHSLHSKETKLLQSELNEIAIEEKEKLREFYETKLSIIYEEMEELKTRLNEAQDLYVKVCQEKTNLESRLVLNQNEIQAELNKAYLTMKQDLRDQIRKEFEDKISLESKDKTSQSSLKEEELGKELDATKEVLKTAQDSLRTTEPKVKYYEELAVEMKKTIDFLQNKLANTDSQLTEFQNHYQNIQEEFIKLITDQRTDFNQRLRNVEQAQRDEIASIVNEVEKLVESEKEKMIARSNQVINQLFERIRELESEKNNSIEKPKSDFSCMVTFDTAKETILMEEITTASKYIKKLEKDMKLRENILQHSIQTQTEVEVVEKKDLFELNQMYKEIILDLQARLDSFCTNSSKNYASKLKSSIIEYHNSMKPKF